MDLPSRINGLDLFSGIGGISEALAPWVRTIAYCERELSTQRILLSRMYRGEIERAPIWDDVRTLRGSFLPPIDVISGGFPCQDLSTAGLQKGLGGERSGLFYQIVRLAKETEAPILFLENVKGVSRFVPAIRNEIESLGYECRDGYLAASDVGARHQRERWFLVAYSDRFAKRKQRGGGSWPSRKDQAQPLNSLEGREDTDSTRIRSQGIFGQQSRQPQGFELLGMDDWDEVASIIRRDPNGLFDRCNRLRTLGNAVVPQQAREAFKKLSGIKEDW